MNEPKHPGQRAEITVEEVRTTTDAVTYVGPLAVGPPPPPEPDPPLVWREGWQMQERVIDEFRTPSGAESVVWTYEVSTPEPEDAENGTRYTYLYVPLTPRVAYKDSTVLLVQLVRAGGKWKLMLRAGAAKGDGSRVVKVVEELPGQVVVRVFADRVEVDGDYPDHIDGVAGVKLAKPSWIGRDYILPGRLADGSSIRAHSGHEDIDGTEDGLGDVQWGPDCGGSVEVVANVAAPETIADVLRRVTLAAGTPMKRSVSGDPGGGYHPFVDLVTPALVRQMKPVGSWDNKMNATPLETAEVWCIMWWDRAPDVQKDRLLALRRIQGADSQFTDDVIDDLIGIVDFPPVVWGEPWLAGDLPEVWGDLPRNIRGHFWALSEEYAVKTAEMIGEPWGTVEDFAQYAESLMRRAHAVDVNLGRTTRLTEAVARILA